VVKPTAFACAHRLTVSAPGHPGGTSSDDASLETMPFMSTKLHGRLNKFYAFIESLPDADRSSAEARFFGMLADSVTESSFDKSLVRLKRVMGSDESHLPTTWS